MVDTKDSNEMVGMLCAAEGVGVIDGRTMLGSVILIRRRGGNFYIPSSSAAGYLKELTAHC